MNKIRVSIVVIIIIILLTGCSLDGKYQNAVSILKEEKWQEARKLLDELPKHFKDISILDKYVLARLEISRNSEDELKENFYKTSLGYLEAIPMDYDGEFKNDIDKFSRILSEKEKEYQQKINEKKINDSVQLVQDERFEEALELISDVIHHKDVRTIRYYILARIERQKVSATLGTQASETHRNEYYQYLSKINPQYNGVLVENINEYVKSYGGWEEIEETIDRINFLEENVKPKPKIGMTEEEVKNSSWGKPKSVNKTTTKYGVREQWVYYSNKYLYLEDGILTGIQE